MGFILLNGKADIGINVKEFSKPHLWSGSPHRKISFLFFFFIVMKQPVHSLRFIYNVFWNIYFATFSEHLCGMYRETISHCSELQPFLYQ